MKLFVLHIILSTFSFIQAQNLSGDAILKKVDENRFSENKVVTLHMIIHGRRGNRAVEAKSWQRKTDETFTEYLAPPRDKGTKMLKLGKNLWIYSPSTDRTIRISGHMLRQSVMGSDLSYEDMMEDPLLQNLYTAIVSEEDTLGGRPCWVLDLKARDEDVAYHSRKVWVDTERFIILKENRYAKSGRLLKSAEISKVTQVEGRWIAKIALFKDVLKQGKGTEFIVDSIDFNADIPDYIFSKASLRR